MISDSREADSLSSHAAPLRRRYIGTDLSLILQGSSLGGGCLGGAGVVVSDVPSLIRS